VDRRRPRRTPLPLLVALVCPGCLIFDPTDFPDPENQLPVISWTEPPAGEVQFVDRRRVEPVVLQLLVFDGNEEDVLDARAFVDPAVDEARRERQITFERAPQGDPRERNVTVELDLVSFTRGCHVIEVVVADSSSTSWIGPREVAAGVGKASETWFYVAHDGDGFEDVATLASCPGADAGDAPEDDGQ
jgi:hypothetical protein